MANDDDNNDNNEYEFSELDLTNPDSFDDNTDETSVFNSENTEIEPPENNVIRNVAVVTGIIILIVLLYKFFGSFYHHKSTDSAIVSTSPSTVQTIPAVQKIPESPAVAQISASDRANSKVESDEIKNRLNALQTEQQNLNTDITNITSQINTLSNNINNLTYKMSSLNQSLDRLSVKLETQTERLNTLFEREKKAKEKKKVVRPISKPTMFYIQALIPGRAWLIATDGSTITVREGSQIKGYGSVKLIDPSQGRILTSSGRIIKFSQQDS